MSKIPFTGKSPQARQQQQQRVVSSDPLQPAEAYNPEHPLLEDPDALATRLVESEDFVRRNKTALLSLLAVVVLAVVGGFGYYLWRDSQDTKGQAALVQAVNYWEADSLQKAMKGDGRNPGLERVASEYSGTHAGNLANFYAGAAALKQGQFKQAIDYLEDFTSDDYLVQARAYSLLGDAHLELNQPKEAADFYSKAANYKANEYFSPGYLLKEATARELAKEYTEAVAAYDKILTEYPVSAEANEAKQYKARAEALTGK
ncbi:hypothetical protein GCM10027346_16050 [Hymenobacter seoulensis]